jgi:hypothetical protein
MTIEATKEIVEKARKAYAKWIEEKNSRPSPITDLLCWAAFRDGYLARFSEPQTKIEE